MISLHLHIITLPISQATQQLSNQNFVKSFVICILTHIIQHVIETSHRSLKVCVDFITLQYTFQYVLRMERQRQLNADYALVKSYHSALALRQSLLLVEAVNVSETTANLQVKHTRTCWWCMTDHTNFSVGNFNRNESANDNIKRKKSSGKWVRLL